MPIDPVTGIAIGSAILGGIKSLSGGGSGINIQDVMRQLRQSRTRTAGAAGRLDEAVLGQALAGGSRLQAQNVLGQQQNRQLEALFNQLGQDELQALQLLLGTQFQQERLGLAKRQQLFDILSQLGAGVAGVLAPKAGGSAGLSTGSSGIGIGLGGGR